MSFPSSPASATPCPLPESATTEPHDQPRRRLPGLHGVVSLLMATVACHAGAFGVPPPPGLPSIPAPVPVPSPPVPPPPFGQLQVTLDGPTQGGQWHGSVHSTGVQPAIGCGSGGACRQTYPHGLPVGLVAMPAAGAIFEGWGGPCAGQALSCGVTIAGGQTREVRAKFSPTQLQVELVGPIGMATDLRFLSTSGGVLGQPTCTRTADGVVFYCSYDLPRGASHLDVRPQAVDGRYPMVSCSGAATCTPSVSNSLSVQISGQSPTNRTARVRLDLGLNGRLLVQKVTGPECATADTVHTLHVSHSGGGPATVIGPGAPAASVPVPIGGTATVMDVTPTAGTTTRWLGCIGSAPRGQPLPLGSSCRVDLASTPAFVTACVMN